MNIKKYVKQQLANTYIFWLPRAALDVYLLVGWLLGLSVRTGGVWEEVTYRVLNGN